MVSSADRNQYLKMMYTGATEKKTIELSDYAGFLFEDLLRIFEVFDSHTSIKFEK